MGNFCQRGEVDSAVVGGILIFGLIILVIGYFIGFNFGLIENEGIVKYDDCRQIITLKEDSWEKYFHKFVCNYTKTAEGTIMRGECVSIESNRGVCERAYVYEKEQGGHCTDPKYPYLGYNDNCYTTPQY